MKIGAALLLTFYVLIRALDMWSYRVDVTVDEVLSRVEVEGNCFDGTYEDYYQVQWAYAPVIIRFGCDA